MNHRMSCESRLASKSLDGSRHSPSGILGPPVQGVVPLLLPGLGKPCRRDHLPNRIGKWVWQSPARHWDGPNSPEAPCRGGCWGQPGHPNTGGAPACPTSHPMGHRPRMHILLRGDQTPGGQALSGETGLGRWAAGTLPPRGAERCRPGFLSSSTAQEQDSRLPTQCARHRPFQGLACAHRALLPHGPLLTRRHCPPPIPGAQSSPRTDTCTPKRGSVG